MDIGCGLGGLTWTGLGIWVGGPINENKITIIKIIKFITKYSNKPNKNKT